MIVKYFYDDQGHKVFDIIQAITDGDWLEFNEGGMEGVVLEDRNDPTLTVTIKSLTYLRGYNMYQVVYVEGGWNMLDHAIEQFKVRR